MSLSYLLADDHTTMLNIIEKILCHFESCFSRKAAFRWFVIIITGLMLRSDKLGVTSILRDLALAPGCYDSMLHFFRASSWSLEDIRKRWFSAERSCGKDKKAVKNSSEDILIFQDTHEPIIDRRTWYLVQELRKTVRRVDTSGEGSLLTGKLYCADCGGKMHYRRSTTRAGRDWRGIPNGEVQHTSAGFNCSTYNSSRKKYKQVCCSHSIKEDTVKSLSSNQFSMP